jgi:DNA-binding NtrC family response regulator
VSDSALGRRLERRLLILAPVGKDAALIEAALAKDGVDCVACPTLDRLAREYERGAAALLVAEEALTELDVRPADLIARQPPWSDIPVLVLTRQGADSAAAARALRTLGNVTLLERPVRLATLNSAVLSALRARERQYQMRAHLAAARGSRSAQGRVPGDARARVAQPARADPQLGQRAAPVAARRAHRARPRDDGAARSATWRGWSMT